MDINELLGYQPIDLAFKKPFTDFKEIIDFETKNNTTDTRWLMLKAYTLGYIEGKRAERQKKAEKKQKELKRLCEELTKLTPEQFAIIEKLTDQAQKNL